MCIRDSAGAASAAGVVYRHFGGEEAFPGIAPAMMTAVDKACLLYTSDAADEGSSVDLGGRRIIKKKKTRP